VATTTASLATTALLWMKSSSFETPWKSGGASVAPEVGFPGFRGLSCCEPAAKLVDMGSGERDPRCASRSAEVSLRVPTERASKLRADVRSATFASVEEAVTFAAVAASLHLGDRERNAVTGFDGYIQRADRP
jgi:hypothetical protein